MIKPYTAYFKSLIGNEKYIIFKSLRNCKRRNKGNFTSNSNKIMLCGGGGQHYLVLNKISMY